MLRLPVILLLTVVLLQMVNADSEEYVPLTREEAENYINNIGISQLIDDIIYLDSLENLPPTIYDPGYTALLTEEGHLVIFPINPIMAVKHGNITYEIKLKTYIIEDFEKPINNRFMAGIITVSSLVAVSAVTFLIAKIIERN